MALHLNYQKDVYTQFFDVAPGVWGMRDLFVNVYMILNPFEGNWVLVDTGFKRSAPKIKKMAGQIFGENSKPSAIILTHGHFDHVGAASQLAEEWDVPVYAHYMEMPYITGRSSYPPPDPSVGGGILSTFSFLYPKTPVNIWNVANVLPGAGRVPGLPEWKYIHTPGHSPGHISLFREHDGVLIAGDAFATTNQESLISVIMQKKQLSGPPKYYTTDWQAAEKSVRKLADLQPEVVATGHGKPMQGSDMRSNLYVLSRHFDEMAKPGRGRYVNEAAASDANGVVYVPPKYAERELWRNLAATFVVGLFALTMYYLRRKSYNEQMELLAYETF